MRILAAGAVFCALAAPASASSGWSQLGFVWPAQGTISTPFSPWHDGIDIAMLRTLFLLFFIFMVCRPVVKHWDSLFGAGEGSGGREVILLLEARRGADGPHWVFAAARFSDMDLWLEHKNQEVWSSIRSEENRFEHDAKHRYRFYEDRTIPEINVSEP